MPQILESPSINFIDKNGNQTKIIIEGNGELFIYGFEKIRCKEYQKQRQYILERDNHKCVYCGTKKEPFQLDHIIPQSKGGLDNTNNLVCACKTCNLKKSDKSLKDLGWKHPPLTDKVVYL